MELIFIFSCIAGTLAIAYGFITARQVLGMSAGTKKMQEISNAIQEGASAYLKRQYYTIALVGVIIFIIIALFLNLSVALGFLVGAILSVMAGFIGMHISVRANVRTTEAAKKSLNDGLGVNRGGSGQSSSSNSISVSISGTTGSKGSGNAHNNVQPTVILQYIIRT